MNETIKKLREQNSYSQTSVASFLGVSRQMYIKYESGEVEPSVKTVKQLSELYKVPYSFIIDDSLATSSKNKDSAKYTISLQNDYVSSPTPAYSASPSKNSFMAHKNGKINFFDSLMEQIRMLPESCYSSILTFTKLLSMENQNNYSFEQKQESASYVAPKKTSKDDFFALEGKISLDNDDLTAFREDSFSGHKK